MIKLLKHVINIAKNRLRDVSISRKRSSAWPKLEKEFKLQYGNCAVCGSKKRLNVHHMRPFHVFPELELDPNNLITLCMDTKECHLLLGHGSDFKAYCPDIKKYVEQLHKKEKTFNELCEIAKNNRLYK